MIMNAVIPGSVDDIHVAWRSVGGTSSARSIADIQASSNTAGQKAIPFTASYSSTPIPTPSVHKSGGNAFVLNTGVETTAHKATYTATTPTTKWAYRVTYYGSTTFGHNDEGGYLHVPVVIASSTSSDTDCLYLENSVSGEMLTADEYDQLYYKISMAGTSTTGELYIGEDKVNVYYNKASGTLRLYIDDSREMVYVPA